MTTEVRGIGFKMGQIHDFLNIFSFLLSFFNRMHRYNYLNS